MSDKLKNDATPSVLGIIYQFYVALEYCFQLTSGQKLYVEKYGDITISKSNQTEVKKNKEVLTDMHDNIWKTLSNWFQKDFYPS